MPRGRTAPGTDKLELQQLAVQEQLHPDCYPLRVQAILWLMRAHAAVMAAQTDELRPLGLSPSGYQVLTALMYTAGRRMEPRQIAEQLQLSRPSVTGLLDTLQERGYVVRRPHRDDRRRVVVELTRHAEDTLQTHFPVHYKEQARILEALSDDDLVALVQLLRTIHGSARKGVAGADVTEPAG